MFLLCANADFNPENTKSIPMVYIWMPLFLVLSFRKAVGETDTNIKCYLKCAESAY